MENFPRGSIPAAEFETLLARTQTEPKKCDLSIICPTCSTEMQPEHAHYRCLKCGYRDSCCF
ncbi:MAG: hypothetical protein H0V17_00635 [Deltaproteobacteria bacterium]|nr:hypothetical protein [Deltaproteobacteria bacterium]